MTVQYRRIFKNQQTGSATIRELLQSMFVGEMLGTGNRIWIVSPWISDIVLIDNRSGNFDSLNPEWGRREVRLTDILIGLMARGADVVIVTRDLDTNTPFLNRLYESSAMHATGEQLIVQLDPLLHTKGILLSHSLLIGSMNLTYNGLEMNDEWIQFSIDSDDIATTRLEFAKYVEAL
ncbi:MULTISPECIES: phospholipase D-like domain-containing protein DpdK [Stutzerimonas stutzeri subgroup]|uniref:phospholipase D-like domain-containing protein DpdK n=1 Tax=Stutzerimonas stutzeri subgroup TaxID=578833 RepID=UPI00289AF27C|nr:MULTISPECIES: phospholipase D-like domain-containing protein DpdK [Stutzerimonas stutzeri subgroup]